VTINWVFAQHGLAILGQDIVIFIISNMAAVVGAGLLWKKQIYF